MFIRVNIMSVLNYRLISPSILISPCNVGRPLNEVKNRVKKQYPSVQLSGWMVCT
jgi:hypothetical protein